MALHFQVISEFSLTKGKPSLVSTSIYSTHSACTSFPFSPTGCSFLIHSYIFPTLHLARSYIAHLYRVHKKPIPPLVLDGGQHDLFMEENNAFTSL